MRRGRPTRVAAWVALLTAVAAACTGSPGADRDPSPGASSPAPRRSPSGRFARVACGPPPVQVLRVWRGYDPARSGDIQTVERAPNYYGNQQHSGPFPYLQRVPMFLYGPGHVPALGRVDRPVTSADVAPTFARHLDYEFDAPDGTAMEEAIEPDADPPRLIVAVVWDGAGRNVLAEYGRAWPEVKGLIPEGVWYEQATVGSSPSVTPAVHATLATGAFPRRHGLIDVTLRVRGKVRTVRDTIGFLRLPTLGDLYDRDRGNRPKVGHIGNNLTLGMLGRGAMLEGADRDVLAIHDDGGSAWTVPDQHASIYRFPSYVNEIEGGLEESIREVDLRDGALDGRWLGEPVLEPETVIETPAYPTYQNAITEEVIRREGFGADDVPDLLFLNYKQPDKVGHRWSMHSPQMEEVLEAVDAAFGDLVDILNRQVGEGEWILALTADHGSTAPSEVSGGFRIDSRELLRDLQQKFDGDGDDRPSIVDVRVTQIWVDHEELAEHGYDVEDVSNFIMRYTKGQDRQDPAEVPPGEEDDLLYEAAFPGPVLEEDLACLPRSGEQAGG